MNRAISQLTLGLLFFAAVSSTHAQLLNILPGNGGVNVGVNIPGVLGAQANLELGLGGGDLGLGTQLDVDVLGLLGVEVDVDIDGGVVPGPAILLPPGLVVVPGTGLPDFDTLAPSDTLVFSPIVTNALSVASLPAPIAQRFATLHGLNAATRDFAGRLIEIRTGRYVSEYKQKLSTEFSGGGAPGDKGKSIIVEAGPESWWELFGQGDALNLDVNDFGFAGGLDASAYVGTAGIEYHPNQYQTLGIGFSWLESDATLGRSLGSVDVNGPAVSVYGSWFDGPLYADGLVSYGWLDNEINRLAPNGRIANASAESYALALQFNTGANFELGQFVTGPYVRAEYGQADVDGYRETGAGLLNLDVDGQNFDSLTSQLGWQLSLPIETARGGFIAPHVRLGWVHEYLGESEDVNATLVSFPANRLTARSIELGQDYGVVGAGLVISLGGNLTLSGDYELLLNDDATNQAGTVSLNVKF